MLNSCFVFFSDGSFGPEMQSSLEELHIVNSWLTRLPPAVRNLTNLKVLDIDRSRISYLPPGVLDGMRKLLDLK